MVSQNRYTEEVPIGEAGNYLMNTWCGSEDEDDGMSVTSERLVLHEDGTFAHTVAHRFAISDSEGSSSTCHGQWRLFNVRHLGADVNAAADKEIGFVRAEGSPTLHVSSLIVCGVNPNVNGFLGAACRLYPERSGAATHIDNGVIESYAPKTPDAQFLAEVTGCPIDECFAALFVSNGQRDEAVARLLKLEQSPSSEAPELAHESSPCPERASQLAEITGQSLAACFDALEQCSGCIDDAVVMLLNLSGDAQEAGAEDLMSKSTLPGTPLSATPWKDHDTVVLPLPRSLETQESSNHTTPTAILSAPSPVKEVRCQADSAPIFAKRLRTEDWVDRVHKPGEAIDLD